jgi:hypothetical protein
MAGFGPVRIGITAARGRFARIFPAGPVSHYGYSNENKKQLFHFLTMQC